MVLETAINGRADAIVTFNDRDLGLWRRVFAVRWCGRGSDSGISRGNQVMAREGVNS
jgi:hypothetical protein